MDNIIIATIKEWNIRNYFLLKEQYQDQYNFHLISNPDKLTLNHISALNPKYIFFPHWSWIIPKEIYKNYNCIVFHMTDLPFGRGGSPLQNLIIRETYDTKISALKVDEKLDAGDIYLKEDFNISTGSAQDIFNRLSSVVFETMIPNLLEHKIKTKKQKGDIVIFQRRKPYESDIKTLQTKSINQLYDFIRMMDADTYPKAYIKLDKLKIEFGDVEYIDGKLIGKFEVKENE